MDPLSLLREYVSGGKLKEVTTTGDRISFGDRFSFLRDARTAYKSRSKDGTFYDLGTLLFFAQNLGPDFKFADYFKKAREAGVGQVTFIDRKVSLCENILIPLALMYYNISVALVLAFP